MKIAAAEKLEMTTHTELSGSSRQSLSAGTSAQQQPRPRLRSMWLMAVVVMFATMFASAKAWAAAPTVTAIGPSSGSSSGGTNVQITGTGFTGATAVKFGVVNAASFTVSSDTLILAVAPAGATNAVLDITVTTPGGTSATSAADRFTYLGASTAICKANGFLGGPLGTMQTQAMQIDLTDAQVLTPCDPNNIGMYASSNDAAGAVNSQTYQVPYTIPTSQVSGPNYGTWAVGVAIINNVGYDYIYYTPTSNPGFAYSDTVTYWTTDVNGSPISMVFTANVGTYGVSPTPTITAVSPSAGPASGGTSVTLTGTNFTGATAVRFGATAATSYTVISATQIVATAPAGVAGTVDVTVTNTAGPSTTSAADHFTYIAAPTVTAVTPGSGPVVGGINVVINGTNFTGATAVQFGATAATGFSVNSATQIVATAPAGSAGTVDVRVTTPGGSSASSAADQFTFLPAPTVSGIAPSSGPVAGGNSVTITGTNFTGATSVIIGGTVAPSFTVLSSTSISASTPAHAAGAVSVLVTTPGGTNAGNSLYTYVSPPTATQSIASAALTQNHAATTFTPVTGAGGAAPLHYSVLPALPTGLVLSSSTGAVSGTPTATSTTTTYTVTVTDANNSTASATFALTVNPAVTATQSVASVVLTRNVAASFTPVLGGGGTPSLTYSILPALPAGLALSPATGLISGTPTSAIAATTYTVTVTDANSAAATNTFVLTVNAAVTATQSVSSATLTQNQAATAFVPVTGGGGTVPLSYSVSPSLPAGLSLNSNTGAVSGTPTASHAATTYTVTVTDANGATAVNTFALTVNSPLTATKVIPSTALTEGYATSFTPVTGSGGSAPLTFSVSPALPAGLVLFSSGTISGAPTVTSPLTSYTMTVTDANNNMATASFLLTVNAAVVATTATASVVLTQNHAASAFTPVTASGGTGSLSYSVSPALPAGLSLGSGSGIISGTPTVSSAATAYTISVTDANGATATSSFSLTVDPAVTATQAVSSAFLTVNHAVTTFTPVVGGGGTAPLSYSIQPTLPPGLALSATTGAVSGLPTATSSQTTYTVTVTDANHATATASFTLAVLGPLTATQAVSSTGLTVNKAATPFVPVTGSGGVGTLSYSVSPALPTGLTQSTSSGTVSGTPTITSPTTTYTVTVTDANSTTATATFALTVNAAVTATTAVASATLTANHSVVTFTPVTGGGGSSPLTYLVAPALPAGLSLSSSTGAITGTPTVTSTAVVYTVTVTDANGATAAATFSLTVNGAVVATQAVASKVLTQNHASGVFTPVTGSGGTMPLTYSVSPALPSGLSLSSATGAVSGTATVASPANTYTVTVTDANAATATATFSLTVNPAVSATTAVATTTLIQNQTATAFTPVTGAGGTTPLSYSVSPALPAGLSLSSTNGAITGTPTVVTTTGTYTVTVTDANGATATATFSLTVQTPLTAGSKSVTAAYNANGSTSTPIDLTSSISGGTATNVSVVTGPSHGSVVSSGLVVTYTPTAGYIGTDSFSYTASGSNGTSGSAVVSITVTGPTITVGPTTLPGGVVNTAYAQSLIASGGAAPYVFSTTVTSGALPAGLSLSSSGAIMGVPTAACTCTFSVSGMDSSTGTGAVNFTSSTITLTIQAAPPTVSSVTPGLGLSAGGTDVTIQGTFFTSTSTVQFGAQPATSVHYISPTQLTAVAPAGAGTVDVTVTTVGGTSVTSAADRFHYIAQAAALTNPMGVAIDGVGNLLIADAGLSYIVKLPVGCSSLSCETIVGGGLTSITGVAIDGSGNLFVLSGGSSGSVTELPWDAAANNFGAQTTVATGLSLPAASPSGIAVDGSGNLYVTDTGNHRVVELPWSASASSYGSPIPLFSGGGSSAPSGIAVDGAGSLYVADSGTQTLVEIQPDGTQTTLASGIHALSVAVDGSGEVYDSDAAANTITRLPWNGTSFGAPVILASGLSQPSGLAVDDSGNLYVANSADKSIAKVTVTTPPSLSFASTKVDATSTDSPQSVTLANIGNAPLSFPPIAGINPTISTGFTLASASTCPQVYASSAAQTLAPGTSCGYAINFTPTSTNIGANQGALVVTNTDRNQTAATQTVVLNGTGIADDTSTVALSLTPNSPVVFGQAVAITAVVKDSTAPSTTPSGSVSFTSTNGASTTTINPAATLSGGTASVSSYTPPAVGTYTITGSYGGALGNIASSSGSTLLVVTQFTPVLAFVPTVTTQTYGTSISAGALDATAADVNGAGIPGSFVYTTTVNGVVTNLVAGTTVLPVGTYTITATFTPTDATDYASGGTITASYAVVSATATVTLSDLAQTYTASGHSVLVATVPANLNVTVTYNGSKAAPVAAGNYAVVATVNDANYKGSATGTLVIAKASPTAVLLASSVNPVLAQNPVSLTATVASSLSTPTGTVVFLDGTTPIGTAILSGGTASFSTSTLSVGSHSLTAVYQGDANFTALSSAAVTQSVLDFALKVSSAGGSYPSQTVVPGGSATYQFTVSPIGASTFPAAITLSATGLPAGATYAISPSTIASGAGATNMTLTVTVPQTVATMERPAGSWGNRSASFALALLLLPLVGRVRRIRKRLGALMLLVCLLLGGLGATSLMGCGGNNGFLGQPQKSYTITVVGTSGALTHSTTVALTVE